LNAADICIGVISRDFERNLPSWTESFVFFEEEEPLRLGFLPPQLVMVGEGRIKGERKGYDD
jgi:hypothetical protein